MKSRPRISTTFPLVFAISASIGILVYRFSQVDGILHPVHISGDSMATAFVGDHFLLHCHDCSIPYRCSVERAAVGDETKCPNCGYEKNIVTNNAFTRGERVLIDHFSWHSKEPQRWEPIALQDPEAPERWIVKRLIGLPHERVAIRQGEIYINDKIQRKSLDEFKRLAILVHNDRFRPRISPGLLPRWQPESPNSNWQSSQSGYRYSRAQNDFDDVDQNSIPAIDWLIFRNWNNAPQSIPAVERDQEAPLVDTYGYNQSLPRGSLNMVADWLLHCQCHWSISGKISLLANTGHDVLQVDILAAERKLIYLRNDVAIKTKPLPPATKDQPQLLEFGTFDQQLILAIDGHVLLEEQIEPAEVTSSNSVRMLAIGAQQGELTVKWPQITRDIYYIAPSADQQTGKQTDPLDGNGFFLLGDNPPRSTDSRRWPNPQIKRNLLRGRVLKFAPSSTE